MLKGKEQLEKVLSALGEHLEDMGSQNITLIVCGGAALNILGFVERTTKDVDVIAFVDNKNVVSKAEPLKKELIEASSRVQKDFNLPENWLNSGPASVVDLGLPEGLMKRVQTQKFGKSLTIHFLSRYDQIHFKLHAAVDQSGGKHYDDLLALKPTAEELEAASKWSMTHDVSEGYKIILKEFLTNIGYRNVAQRL